MKRKIGGEELKEKRWLGEMEMKRRGNSIPEQELAKKGQLISWEQLTAWRLDWHWDFFWLGEGWGVVCGKQTGDGKATVYPLKNQGEH